MIVRMTIIKAVLLFYSCNQFFQLRASSWIKSLNSRFRTHCSLVPIVRMSFQVYFVKISCIHFLSRSHCWSLDSQAIGLESLSLLVKFSGFASPKRVLLHFCFFIIHVRWTYLSLSMALIYSLIVD
jgi:hypothetical protein